MDITEYSFWWLCINLSFIWNLWSDSMKIDWSGQMIWMMMIRNDPSRVSMYLNWYDSCIFGYDFMSVLCLVTCMWWWKMGKNFSFENCNAFIYDESNRNVKWKHYLGLGHFTAENGTGQKRKKETIAVSIWLQLFQLNHSVKIESAKGEDRSNHKI